MTSQKWIGFGVAMIIGSVATVALAKPPVATATLRDTAGKEVGRAVFKTDATGAVNVDLTVSGLPAGPHAMHIHEAGKCEAPDFKTAGGHFNPASKHHGHKNPQGWHAGDMPNVVVGKDGKGKTRWTNTDVTLAPNAANSLFHPGGTSLVIHASPDDDMSDPAGNAGARIACGVVEK